MQSELDPVDRLTTDALGPPGQRVFYLQARKGSDLVTLLVEKQQIELLSAWIVDMLTRLGEARAEPPPAAEMKLEEPVEPRWRAGRISLGYDEERDMMFLEIEELIEEEEEGSEEMVSQGDAVRIWASKDQMMALARHGAEVCAAGRPRCEFCGNPMDPEGHNCPALNGHQEPGEA